MTEYVWQLIESAPKADAEGRMIEIMIAGGTFYDSMSMHGDLPFEGWTLACWDGREWRGENSGGHDEFYYHKPTHWMPKIPGPDEAVNSHAANSARIAALEGALDGMVLVCGRTGDAYCDFEEQAEAFYRETMCMRPGKSVPMEMARDDEDERRAKYSAWVKTKLDAGRTALASTEAMKGE